MMGRMQSLTGSLTALSLSCCALACSGSAELTCPAPVGAIVRDDCEAYRTRYEALKVELGASVGPAGASVALGPEKLREMSQLIQVLRHRTFSLCRDFNACRVPPLEYRQRREETDRVFAAVAAIQQQLQQAELDAGSKRKLVDALIAALGGAARPAPAASGRSTSYRAGGVPYKSWLPWFGTKLLPPQPPLPPAGFPRLAWVEAEVRASRRMVERRAVWGGFAPSVRVALQGKVQSDDTVIARWEGGRATESPVSRSPANGLVIQWLKAPQEIGLTGQSFSVEVAYRRGMDGKLAVLGRRSFPVLTSQEETYRGRIEQHHGVDFDPDARRGLLMFRPLGRALPPSFERPSIFVVLKLRKYHKPTARCWVDGKPVGGALLTGRGSGQHATFQDRPRHESIAPGRSRGVREAFVEWWHYDFPLPFVVAREGGTPPDKLGRWPLPGKWRCVVSVEGEQARELTFDVLADGRLRPHPDQARFARAEWLVTTRVLKNPVEVPPGEFHRWMPDGPSEEGAPALPAAAFHLGIGPIRGPLSAGQVRAAMEQVRAAIRACAEREQIAGTFRFKVHVYPGSGAAGINMATETDFSLSRCFSKAVKQAKFPKAARGYTYFPCEVRVSGSWPVVRRGPILVSNARGGLKAAELADAFSKVLPELRRCAGRSKGGYRGKASVGKDGKLKVQEWTGGRQMAVTHCLGQALGKAGLPQASQYTLFTIELRLGR